MSTDPDQPIDLADDDPVVIAVASRLGANSAAFNRPRPAPLSSQKTVDPQASPPTISSRPDFASSSGESPGPADEIDRTGLPGKTSRPVDGPVPPPSTFGPSRLGISSLDPVDAARPTVDATRVVADAGGTPALGLAREAPTLARLPGPGLFASTFGRDPEMSGGSTGLDDPDQADLAPTVDLRGRLGGETAGLGLYGGEMPRTNGLGLPGASPSVDGGWGAGGASSLPGNGSSAGLNDLSKTNELLQQLLDAFRRQRGSPLPPSGGSVAADR